MPFAIYWQPIVYFFLLSPIYVSSYVLMPSYFSRGDCKQSHRFAGGQESDLPKFNANGIAIKLSSFTLGLGLAFYPSNMFGVTLAATAPTTESNSALKTTLRDYKESAVKEEKTKSSGAVKEITSSSDALLANNENDLLDKVSKFKKPGQGAPASIPAKPVQSTDSSTKPVKASYSSTQVAQAVTPPPTAIVQPPVVTQKKSSPITAIESTKNELKAVPKPASASKAVPAPANTKVITKAKVTEKPSELPEERNLNEAIKKRNNDRSKQAKLVTDLRDSKNLVSKLTAVVATTEKDIQRVRNTIDRGGDLDKKQTQAAVDELYNLRKSLSSVSRTYIELALVSMMVEVFEFVTTD